jgi:hypothetical protein
VGASHLKYGIVGLGLSQSKVYLPRYCVAASSEDGIEHDEFSGALSDISLIAATFQVHVTKTAKCNSNRDGQGQRSA